MRQHVFVMLLDEFTVVYVVHLHVCLTLNIFVVPHVPEESPRPVLNLHDGEGAIFVRHDPVDATHDVVAGAPYGTHFVGVKGVISLEARILLGRPIFVTDPVVGVECLTDIVLGGVYLTGFEITQCLYLVHGSFRLLFDRGTVR